MQDKQVPCRIAGCENTWTWFAAQQIRGFGQPPPDRMCDEHLGQFNELADREVPCRTPGCPNTWTWKRGAQLAEMQRTGKLRRPSRLCADCFAAERETHDVELPCKVDGCKRTWTWTRDAQLRHRLWVLRQRAKADAAAARATNRREGEGEEGNEAPRGRGRREGEEVREGNEAPRGRGRRDGEGQDGNAEAPRSRGRGRDAEGQDAARDGSVEAAPGGEGSAEAPRGRGRGRGRDGEGNREAGEAPRMRNRGAREAEVPSERFDLAVTLERPLPLITEGPGDIITVSPAVSEDMSSGAGSQEHVPEASSSEGGETQTDAQAEGEARVEVPGASDSGEPGEGGDRRKRRRKRRRTGSKAVPNPEGPPERMCGLCAQKLSRVQPREQPCKVHGCSRTWTWDRASQMRAWVLSGSDDVEFEPAAPKRMCEVCREFCRTHPDREVPCGRPGCGNSWTFKTGAQLQAFLAGRTADPLKLCGECARGEFAATFRPGAEGGGVPEGAETMPCVVPGCEGTWLYVPGMRLKDTAYGELSTDRMCDAHRQERGLAAAAPPEVAEVEVTAADLAVDEPDPDDVVDGAEAGETDHEDPGADELEAVEPEDGSGETDAAGAGDDGETGEGSLQAGSDEEEPA